MHCATPCLCGPPQVELKGNRGIAASPWAVVKALGRAFPLQLQQQVEEAQGGVVDKDDSLALLDQWLRLALDHGVLPLFLRKMSTQPQILSAYGPAALIRNKQLVQQVAEVLIMVEVSESLYPSERTLDLAPPPSQLRQQYLPTCARPSCSCSHGMQPRTPALLLGGHYFKHMLGPAW